MSHRPHAGPALTEQIIPKARQVAALPVRRNDRGALEVLLLTSRETRRWIIPKGWPWSEYQDHTAAKGEAFEEAGVTGKIGKTPIGSYSYVKRREREDIPVSVTVYLLNVERELDKWPEKKERRRVWYTPAEAAGLVHEEGLCSILLALAAVPETSKTKRPRTAKSPAPSKKRAATGRR